VIALPGVASEGVTAMTSIRAGIGTSGRWWVSVAPGISSPSGRLK
jgi:hypothetical protein